MRLAAAAVFLLLFVSTAWAVEPCLDNDCTVVHGKGEGCAAPKCFKAVEPPCEKACKPDCGKCPPASCKPDCKPDCGKCEPVPDCGKCKPVPCANGCEDDCGIGMEALMQPITKIPVPDGFSVLDPDCCPRGEYRKIPCEEWCNEYTTCCRVGEYELLCQPECVECPPPPPKCRQDTCTPAAGCDCVDQTQGITIGCDS